MRLSVPGPRVLLLTLVGACANDAASPKADEASPAPEDSGEPPAPDDSGEPPAPDCGRGTPSEGLSARVTTTGHAFSGDPWTCSVRNLVDPIGDGVTIAYNVRSDSELEVLEETANSITVGVPYPEEVGSGIWGFFQDAECEVTLTDSADCSVELSSEAEVGWFDPRSAVAVDLTVRTTTGVRYVSASGFGRPPSRAWGVGYRGQFTFEYSPYVPWYPRGWYPPFYDWYRNGELVYSGYVGALSDVVWSDVISVTVRHIREDGLELRGEARITVPIF